jgi:hypothetical protein
VHALHAVPTCAEWRRLRVAQVTVVDGYNFFRDCNGGESLVDRKLAAFSGDERAVVDLLIDQIEFADGQCASSPPMLLFALGFVLFSTCQCVLLCFSNYSQQAGPHHGGAARAAAVAAASPEPRRHSAGEHTVRCAGSCMS